MTEHQHGQAAEPGLQLREPAAFQVQMVPPEPEPSQPIYIQMRAQFPASHGPCQCGMPACRSGWPEEPRAQFERDADAARELRLRDEASADREAEAGA